jgi:hypothetical protein
MQLANLLYAHALEGVNSVRAKNARDDARALGWIAALAGDEMALDYRSRDAHAQFQRDSAMLAKVASRGEDIEPALDRMLDRTLSFSRGSIFSTKSRP